MSTPYDSAPPRTRQAAVVVDHGLANARPDLSAKARRAIVEQIFTDAAALGLTLQLVEDPHAWRPRARRCAACGSDLVTRFCGACGARIERSV